MKKLIFTLAITLGVVASSTAQEAGRMWIGGSLGFSHSKMKVESFDAKSTSFDILPEFGYFINDNFAVAARVGYQHSKISGSEEMLELLDMEGVKSHMVTINPFVRYTFLKGSIGTAFVDGGVFYNFGKTGDYKNNEFGLAIRPGAAINIGNGFAITATIGEFGYTHSEIKTDPKIKGDDIRLGLNLDKATFGVMYTF